MTRDRKAPAQANLRGSAGGALRYLQQRETTP